MAETRVCVLCDRSGKILAAHPVDLRTSGEDGPTGLRMAATDGQTMEVVTIPQALTKMSPHELFRTHLVRNGKLVLRKTNRK